VLRDEVDILRDDVSISSPVLVTWYNVTDYDLRP